MVNFILKKRTFKFHFLVTLFSGGIWLFIYLLTLLYSKRISSCSQVCKVKTINQFCVHKTFDTAKTLKTDLIEFSYHNACCSECAKYRGRVFSISGKDKRFPKLPEHIAQTGCVHDGCRCTFYPFIYDISEPSCEKAKNIIQFSNRPFVDDRTKKEKADYKEFIKQMEIEYQKEIDKKIL